jgi:hypothetical protein
MARSPQIDRYHPVMPSIPGVPSARRASILRWLRVAAVVLGVILLGWFALVVRQHLRACSSAHAYAAIQQQDSASAAPVSAPPPAAPEPTSAGEIAPLADLAKPWSSKTFTYFRPLSHDPITAMVIRLPSATAGRGSSYWAFSLTEPFGTCQLSYVTNLGVLATQYGYTASHPMVVDPCTQTVFDPLRMGQRSDGAWVRGDIVQGGGLRPPMAIEVSVRGNTLYANRME